MYKHSLLLKLCFSFDSLLSDYLCGLCGFVFGIKEVVIKSDLLSS